MVADVLSVLRLSNRLFDRPGESVSSRSSRTRLCSHCRAAFSFVWRTSARRRRVTVATQAQHCGVNSLRACPLANCDGWASSPDSVEAADENGPAGCPACGGSNACDEWRLCRQCQIVRLFRIDALAGQPSRKEGAEHSVQSECAVAAWRLCRWRRRRRQWRLTSPRRRSTDSKPSGSRRSTRDRADMAAAIHGPDRSRQSLPDDDPQGGTRGPASMDGSIPATTC